MGQGFRDWELGNVQVGCRVASPMKGHPLCYHGAFMSKIRSALVVLLVGLTACTSDDTSEGSANLAADAGSAKGAAPPVAANEASAVRSEGPAAVSSPAGGTSGQLPSFEVGATPMLIRVGHASVRVDSLAVGLARIRDLARRTGALVANTTVSAGDEQQKSATIELRVPAERFDEVVNGLSPLGKLEGVNVSVQDVGEEYTDVAARVANAKRLEARLVELLASRTGKLSDVLTVERELARVREEIERYEGRMRYLRVRTAYSSLTITVHERYPIIAPPGHNPITEALREAWRRFVWLVAAFIASLGVLLPVAAIGIGAWVMIRRVRAARPQE